MIVILFILLLIGIIYIYFIKRKSISNSNVSKSSSLYIDTSDINGEGLFSDIIIKKNEIILSNLFPYKPYSTTMETSITTEEFMNYLSDYGKKINHCSTKDNSTIVSSDNKLFQLHATKDIYPGQEITVNYDVTHHNYPFIDHSHSHYKSC